MTIVGLTMALNAARFGLSDLEISYAREISDESRVLAEGCVENTLHRIRRDTNYGVGAGAIELSLSKGSCTIEVEDLGADRRSITAAALVNDYERIINILITLSGNIIIVDSWWEDWSS